MKLTIRFNNGHDIIISPSTEARISDIKRLITDNDPLLVNKHLRVLYGGRILHDSALARREFGDGSGLSEFPLVLHCAISEIPFSDRQAPDQHEVAKGFDRLLEIGFSQEEVNNLRSQFHAIRGSEFNERDSAARTAEEDWIDNRNPSIRENDGHVEMLLGLMVGFFMGILALFWIKEHGLFTRRQQMGIIAGLLINISFGLQRMR